MHGVVRLALARRVVQASAACTHLERLTVWHERARDGHGWAGRPYLVSLSAGTAARSKTRGHLPWLCKGTERGLLLRLMTWAGSFSLIMSACNTAMDLHLELLSRRALRPCWPTASHRRRPHRRA